MMSAPVKLLGLDFGTTTSSAVVAGASLTRNSVTGRTDLTDLRESFRSELIFTPHHDGRLDVEALERSLDAWLRAGGVVPEELFGGGALLTGLTAQQGNAHALVRLVRRRLGDALIATADDPCLESWLAFMGSCSALSRSMPRTPLLNLDVGGGTTNLALGLGGEVLRTGCLFVGARHVQVVPGTYRIVKLSRYARALFDHHGIHTDAGEELTGAEVDRVLDFYVGLLEEAIGARSATVTPAGRLHVQIPFHPPDDLDACEITVSGGVGELIYAHLNGGPWPTTTHYGDLGIDLARRLVDSPWWAERLRRVRPASAGRATVYGLLRHSTEISGSTLFLPDPAVLPLDDLPIVGTVGAACSPERLDELLALAASSGWGACLRVEPGGRDTPSIRRMGQFLAAGLRRRSQGRLPLVLLLSENAGKTLGHYVTEWGALPCRVVVIDEVPARDAHFARLGRMRQQVVPVSFYGLR
jgi:ethanolamine utilization protein EutA